MNSRVPLAIEWTEAGRSERFEAITVNVSRKGCLLLAPHELAVGQRLRVVNLVTNETAEAVLAWRGHHGPSGWELGLKLTDPPTDFWGLDV